MKYKAERYSKGYHSWDHFVAMLFCQLHQAKSFREICGGLGCCTGKLRHSGMNAAPKKPPSLTPIPTGLGKCLEISFTTPLLYAKALHQTNINYDSRTDCSLSITPPYPFVYLFFLGL
ncbi:MAG: DUF4372 domain-containing protein, partial [Thermodesulfobacteriota bacterium]|nr:DUF4372 domain-containing protein [Thermodesulfobacteriota bacterium]